MSRPAVLFLLLAPLLAAGCDPGPASIPAPMPGPVGGNAVLTPSTAPDRWEEYEGDVRARVAKIQGDIKRLLVQMSKELDAEELNAEATAREVRQTTSEVQELQGRVRTLLARGQAGA